MLYRKEAYLLKYGQFYHSDALDHLSTCNNHVKHSILMLLTNVIKYIFTYFSLFHQQLVKEMNRLGMLIDLAHVPVKVMHQVLDMSEAPVIFSHSSAYSICEHKRNVPDEVLRRVVSTCQNWNKYILRSLMKIASFKQVFHIFLMSNFLIKPSFWSDVIQFLLA